MKLRTINRDITAVLLVGVGVTAAASLACLIFGIIPACISLASGLIITAAFLIYTNKRYDDIAELNDYLSRICAGIYELKLPDNTEGELSVLRNNLYKVILILNNQNDKLSKDKTFLTDTLADISHQIKTPLTSAVMMTDLLRDESDPEKRAEFIEILSSQLNKINWLVRMLLKLSKLDAGTVRFNKKHISAQQLIKLSVQPFLVPLDIKNITLETSADDSIVFDADITWTLEALSNIIKNCMEHTPSGGKIKITADETSLFREILIEDTGCGISQADLPHIFERFYRAGNAAADSVGIGLALSKSIIESQNGRISVQSEEGKGSLFSVRFYKSIV